MPDQTDPPADRPAAPAAPAAEEPHYIGHRRRLRQKFLDHGPDALNDYELLEMVLGQAIPRRDVKPLAKHLIDRFGGFAGVIATEPSELMREKGIGETAAVALKTIQSAAVRMLKDEVKGRSVLNSWDKVMDYCLAAMAREKTEQFRILFLDTKHRLITDEVQNRGTVDHTPAYPREVVRRALEVGASGLILAHNHPTGDPTPSDPDIEVTRQIRDAAKALGITLHDHVIVAREGYISFRTKGLI